MTERFLTPRDRLGMGSCNCKGIRLFTGYHVSEALALQMTDIKSGAIT
ncbi:hypothetical protein [Nostoc sp.]